MKCSNCGSQMPDGSVFCGKCGQKLEQRALCPHCGAELIPGMAYCAACGIKVGTAPAATPKEIPTPPPDPVQTAPLSFDDRPVVHIKGGNCVFGDVSMTNNGEMAAFTLFSDHISIASKFNCNAVILGGWLGMAISRAKSSKKSTLDIPYSEFAEVSFCKAKMDTAKRATILLKTGDTVRLLVAPMNKLMSGCDHISTEELYRRIQQLAQPYMG